MEKRIKQLLDEAQEELENEDFTDLKISLEAALELVSLMI